MKRILSTLIAFTLMACNLLPHAPDKTDTRMVYVWPTEVCPSLAAGAPSAARSAILAGLATTLIGNVVTGVVGIPAAALAAAADADTQGLKATGTNARFYYQIEKSAVSNTVELIPPSCYVVAYSKPQRNGKHWCEDSTFSNSVTETCREGMTALKQLKVREDLSGNNGPGIEGLSVPEIYLEIGFDSSSYPDVVRPKIVAMHYPNSVIQPNSDEPRAISLQLDFTSPQKDDPLKAAAQVVMVIPSVKPASPVDAFSLSNVITGWTSIPTKGVQPTTVPTEKSKYLPVTIKATLNEVGDPHAFLQAFAKAFGASSGDYTKTISNEITPLSQATAQQTQDKNDADFTAALAAAQKSRGDLLAACAANPTTPQAKAVAESLYTTTVANQRKANNAADIAGASRQFSPPSSVAGVSKCW